MSFTRKNIHLTWEAKSKIISEFDKRGGVCGKKEYISISNWAKNTLKISKALHYRTFERIIKDRTKILRFVKTRAPNEKHINLVQCQTIDTKLAEWVCVMNWLGCFISNAVIQTKALQLQEEFNFNSPGSVNLSCKYSRGWLRRFKIRHKFKAYKAHGEQCDADYAAYIERLPFLGDFSSQYQPHDVWNCDEFALYYRMSPKSTVGYRPIWGRKKDKTRVTFLACTNSTGTEKFPLYVVGRAAKPHCFRNISIEDLGVVYAHSKKAWMTTMLFFQWLKLSAIMFHRHL